MKNLVSEQFFSTKEAHAVGIIAVKVIAVKVIAVASAAGQKIWKITSKNVESALEEISLFKYIEIDIRNSVNVGRIVTNHEAQPEP